MIRNIGKDKKFNPSDNLVELGMSFGESLITWLDQRTSLAQSKVHKITSSLEQNKQNLEVKSLELESLNLNYKLALREIYKIQCKANLSKKNALRAELDEHYTYKGGSPLKYFMIGVSVLSINTLVWGSLIRIISGSDNPSFPFGLMIGGVITLVSLINRREYYPGKYAKENPNKRLTSEEMLEKQRKELKLSGEKALLTIGQAISSDERRKLHRQAKKEFYQIESQIRNETRDQSKQRLESLQNDMLEQVERFYESDIGKSIQTLMEHVDNIEKSLVSERDLLTKAELELKNKQKQAEYSSIKSYISHMTNNVISSVIQLAQGTQQSFSLNAHQSTDLNSYMKAFEELIHGSSEAETKGDYTDESAKNDFEEISSCIETLKKQPSKNDIRSALKIILTTKGLYNTPEAAEKLLLEVAPTRELCEVTAEHYKDFVGHLCRSLFASENDLLLENIELPKVQPEEVSRPIFLN